MNAKYYISLVAMLIATATAIEFSEFYEMGYQHEVVY